MDFDEFKELLVAQGNAFETFKKNNESRFADINRSLNEIAKKAGRPGFSMGGGNISAEDQEHKTAFLGWMRSGREADLQTKAMQVGSDPDGGYLVPKQLDIELTKVLRDLSPMRQLARVVEADGGDFSMLHSLGGTGYSWVGETSSRPGTNTPNWQKVTPVIGEVYANPGVTQTLLDDSGWNLEEWLLSELAEVFTEAEGDAFINGNGAVKPRGILTYDTSSGADGVRDSDKLQYVASGAAGAFAGSNPADNLIALVHSLKPAYRNGAAWLMNTNTVEELRKIKDGTGNFYLWRPSLEAGQPDTLLGYPVFEDENMPDMVANSLSIAFGNFQRGYTIVDRSTAMLRDPFTNKPYVHFYTSRRVGGAVRDFRAIKLMKFAAN